MLIYLSCMVLAVGTVLWSEWKGRRLGVWLGKPAASLLFVLIAFLHGAPETTYGQLILVALGLCVLGDMFLIPRHGGTFVFGLGTFLLAHLVYAAAFALKPQSLHWAGIAAAVIALLGAGVLRWLWPQLSHRMRVAVAAYVVAIGLMVASAAGAAMLMPTLLTAAGLFAISDIFVARQRFASPGILNRAIGLPLYYVAQVVFASSV